MTPTLKFKGRSLFICKKEEIMTLILSLLTIGIIATYSGKIVEKFKLPALIGMMIEFLVIF